MASGKDSRTKVVLARILGKQGRGSTPVLCLATFSGLARQGQQRQGSKAMDESEGGFLLYSENIEPPIPTIVILRSLDCLDSSVIIQTVPRLPGFGYPTNKRAVTLTYAMFRGHFIWFYQNFEFCFYSG